MASYIHIDFECILSLMLLLCMITVLTLLQLKQTSWGCSEEAYLFDRIVRWSTRFFPLCCHMLMLTIHKLNWLTLWRFGSGGRFVWYRGGKSSSCLIFGSNLGFLLSGLRSLDEASFASRKCFLEAQTMPVRYVW